VEHIPGGCTGLCQPIDVGIGKPLKSKIRHKWEEWMLEVGVDSILSRPPERQQLAQWIITSLAEISEGETVRNSWRHTKYSFFPQEEGEEESGASTTTTEEGGDADDTSLSSGGGGTDNEDPNMMHQMTEDSNTSTHDDSSSFAPLPETMAFVSNLNDVVVATAPAYNDKSDNDTDKDDSSNNTSSEFDDDDEEIDNSGPLL
jgi:hypothetical protein